MPVPGKIYKLLEFGILYLNLNDNVSSYCFCRGDLAVFLEKKEDRDATLCAKVLLTNGMVGWVLVHKLPFDENAG